MWLVIQFFHVMRLRLLVSIRLNLLGQELQVLHVVLFLELGLVHCNQVLFLFLPIKLLSLKLTRVLDLLALILEALVRQIVDFLDVVNVLLALVLCVIIYFEGALRSHEVRICLRMVIGRYLLTIQCQPYYRTHII